MISPKIATLLLVCLALCFAQQVENKTPVFANTSCTTDCCKSLPSRSAMTYYFYQNTGRFKGGSGEWAINTMTYSGQNQGYLNPDYQCAPNKGPLPATTYNLGYCTNFIHETTKRPCSFYLDPQRPNEMCERSTFFIRGCKSCTSDDDLQPPGPGCSAGSIIMNFANRRKLRVGDTLIVLSFEPSVDQKGEYIQLESSKISNLIE